ncbi:MAG TPA: GNAT family N-acetyltransferase [Candidatus Limnocylindrales bacterium]|nr:GNAT family N-acetyltransferase [Candidatus Limnocylindrales bacterium]
MDLRRYGDVAAFLAAAEPFLVEREAEHNLILGVTSNLRDAPEEFTGAPYLATVLANGRVVAAAMQTPPFNLVLSEIDHPGAVAALADDLIDRDLPGALGPVDHVRAFVDARLARGGSPARLIVSERIFRLTEVRPPAPVPGRVRAAEPADRPLVLAWIDAFMREALEPTDPADVAAMTDRWLARRGRGLHLWEDGAVVSLAGIGSPTPHGVRVGPVYTPPDRRGRGYASALVAGISQSALDAGRTFCFLFTDLANPTSNHIYETIGYRPVRDVDMWRFERPAP